MNPFPNAPGVTKLEDGRMLLETRDCGRCIQMIEPNGKVSMVITGDWTPPPKLPAPTSAALFHVRPTSNGQEIVSAGGEIIATTTDEKQATHICKLLIVWGNLKANQGGK